MQLHEFSRLHDPLLPVPALMLLAFCKRAFLGGFAKKPRLLRKRKVNRQLKGTMSCETWQIVLPLFHCIRQSTVKVNLRVEMAAHSHTMANFLNEYFLCPSLLDSLL